jgi:hypothetical protein
MTRNDKQDGDIRSHERVFCVFSTRGHTVLPKDLLDDSQPKVIRSSKLFPHQKGH